MLTSGFHAIQGSAGVGFERGHGALAGTVGVYYDLYVIGADVGGL
ncbi:MAG: hypothetical protein ABI824_00520 [Acidobacteriota bacterium]